ncbi:rod shape-determining protein MreD [Rhodohalobacter sulfatireducens]|uniref:Rod shape-determining protein MreD n=1 Tax=Rhodohalobacter sulfatireducens TaxID=2911366 RepID=A0ABS9KEA4_9BACT|nr:rod shape-determining protein MreD [Rhodohalobacter sulfatireducens]MCG2589160.1 rod shape-determining protein MreD [Rhodohalobacter sulfatireducens]
MILSENVRLILIGIGIVVIQTVLLRHFEIFGSEADLVLVFLLWICAKQPKINALLFAGFLGFSQDALTDLWGLHMFSKTLLIFILHGYLNRISNTGFIFWQVFLLILVSAIIHNLIFYGVSLFSGLYTSIGVLWSFLLVSSVFTAILGSFIYLVREDL